jgi:hypothetical protein
MELLGWTVAIDESLRLDPQQPFHTGADGDTIVAVQPLDEGRVGVFVVTAGD